jgi:Acetyltransferase (GNAT) domain
MLPFWCDSGRREPTFAGEGLGPANIFDRIRKASTAFEPDYRPAAVTLVSCKFEPRAVAFITAATTEGIDVMEKTQLRMSLFHEPWWLSAATGGQFQEVVVKQGDDLVGRLPYVMKRRGPFTYMRMPPFTHILGPVIEAGDGKPQTRLQRRISITCSLLDQLPPHSYFQQALDPSLDGGLAVADGLAFQQRKFEVMHQYTFEIDCRRSLTDLSAGLNLKTRQHIRRAEKEYSVRSVDDPKSFIDFYVKNVHARGRKSRIDFEHFSALFAESRARQSGVILGALDHTGVPVAMTYLVWGHGVMYYLLSTRSFDAADSGAVSLLIWCAMKEAHEMGLVLDLDGVYSSGSARFLSNFGGDMKTRFLIQRSRIFHGTLQFIKRQVAPSESQFFT